VEATLEELRCQIAELDLHPEGYMSMFEQSGEYYRRAIPAKGVAQERRRLGSLLDWARNQCDVIAAVPAVDPSPEMAASLDRGLGHAVYDTLLAAQGGHYILVSDDFNLRRLAMSEFGIEAIWIQPLLMYAADTQRLKQDHYNRAVVQLATWRHEFTSINAQQLLFAANRGGWKVTSDFDALASTLALNRTDLRSNVLTCFQLLNDLWKKRQGPTKSQARKLTHALLRGVDPGKSSNNETFFRELLGAVQHGLLPQGAGRAIVEWYRSQKPPPAFP
jgi:hypothetical protein